MIRLNPLAERYRSESALLDDAWKRAALGGTYIGGDIVEVFEHEFASYIGSQYCIGVGNGFDALRLALEAFDIGPGDEVIVPAQSFTATWLAVTQVGATPIPVDVEAGTNNINPELIEEAISSQTSAIIPVHLHGNPARMSRILEIARSRGLVVIEDAAQAHGATTSLGKAGGLGDAGCFSFYPTKNLGAMGDAGAVVTSDPRIATKIRRLRSYGANPDRPYVSVIPGWNTRLDSLQAAFLSSTLPRLDSWNDERVRNARFISDTTQWSDYVRPLQTPETAPRSVWHHFVLLASKRDSFRENLANSGIETAVHYPVPLHRAPAFAKFRSNWKDREFPVSEWIADHCLSVPIHPWLGNDRERVASVIQESESMTMGAKLEGEE